MPRGNINSGVIGFTRVVAPEAIPPTRLSESIIAVPVISAGYEDFVAVIKVSTSLMPKFKAKFDVISGVAFQPEFTVAVFVTPL